jgi:hypothetical protein
MSILIIKSLFSILISWLPHESRDTGRIDLIRITPVNLLSFSDTTEAPLKDAVYPYSLVKPGISRDEEFLIEGSSDDKVAIEKEVAEFVKMNANKNLERFILYRMNFRKLPKEITSNKIQRDFADLKKYIFYFLTDPYLQYEWHEGKFNGVKTNDQFFYTDSLVYSYSLKKAKKGSEINIVPLNIVNITDTFQDNNKITTHRLEHFLVEGDISDSSLLSRKLDDFAKRHNKNVGQFDEFQMIFYGADEYISAENINKRPEIITRKEWVDGDPLLCIYDWLNGRLLSIMNIRNGNLINNLYLNK